MTAYQLLSSRWRHFFPDRLAWWRQIIFVFLYFCIFLFFYSMPKTLHCLALRLFSKHFLTKYLVGFEYRVRRMDWSVQEAANVVRRWTNQKLKGTSSWALSFACSLSSFEIKSLLALTPSQASIRNGARGVFIYILPYTFKGEGHFLYMCLFLCVAYRVAVMVN